MTSVHPARPAPSVETTLFGATPEGIPVHLHTLRNASGLEAAFMDYGATLVRLRAPDRNGMLDDIALGFDTFDPYLRQTAYLGGTIGRYANRIAGGRLVIDGQVYQLPLNDGGNTLHGGAHGFDRQMWEAETLPGEGAAIRFVRVSPDGEEGFPGEVRVSVTCRLHDANELDLLFEATTTRPTVVNMTNHAYFNLAGPRSASVLDHEVTIPADFYTPVGGNLIPTGELAPVAGTAMDLTRPTRIGSRIREVGSDPLGYDHNYVLRKSADSPLLHAATVCEPTSGRELRIWTVEPGIQFYTANFFDGSMIGRMNQPYLQYGAFALEPQHFPDSPNQPAFPSTELRPGETYSSRILYQFGAR